MEEYDYLMLRHSKHRGGGIDVVGIKTMPEYSVLAGQQVTCFIDNFPTEEEARKAYPEVGENITSHLLQPTPSVSHLPGEDDPVPGGMYPDDYDDGY